MYNKYIRSFVFCALLGLVFLIPMFALPHASAHEVYVLSPEMVAHNISTPSPNPFDAFYTNMFQFFFWGFMAFVLVTTVFFMSLTHRLEVFFEPYLVRLRLLAPLAVCITLGLSFIASAYHFSLFGPELSLGTFGALAPAVQLALYTAGVLLVFGYFVRAMALVALAVFAAATALHGLYMLNYLGYLGAIAAMVLVSNAGAQAKRFLPHAFLILRITFGISIIFAALYAKFIYSNLALSTVVEYNLVQFFPFEPLFIVLGAGIIELLIGTFFIIGFEIRHTALFFLFWIFLSLLYFGESVWPHLVLIGITLALFMYGYDFL